MTILVTGGAGYIGSITCEMLADKGKDVLVFDSLYKGHKQAIDPRCEFMQGDLKDSNLLESVFQEYNITAVIHFAADSLVAESVDNPRKYFQNNVVNGMNLLRVMRDFNVKKIIFSSTAAVYGESDNVPLTESSHTKPTNPYGASKLFFEDILKTFDTDYEIKNISLRYFNAAGASEKFGEDHNPETHLIPIIMQVAAGKLDSIKVFGTDYPTADGSCVRDYIHVVDIAQAHILALESLEKTAKSNIYNLGNGNGYSVFEVIQTAKKITGKNIPFKLAERREGDPATLIASSDKIKKELGWKPKYASLEDIISSAYKWHLNNPNGYKE